MYRAPCLLCSFHWPSIYIGNAAPDTNGSTNSRVVEPVYWCVALQRIALCCVLDL